MTHGDDETGPDRRVVVRWADTTREQLAELLPEALVVLSTGATEQHGPHLPTGTDAVVAQELVDRATQRGGFPRSIIIAPTITIGSSDHHFPFGGTLSLTPETLIAVLTDIARSIATCGGRRLVLVNGHGGNQGPCASAAAAASTRYDIAVAYADYWDLMPLPSAGEAKWPRVPGHAGGFETSLMLALRPKLVAQRVPRELVNPSVNPAGFTVYSAGSWRAMNGHTDNPATGDAALGAGWLDAMAETLAVRLSELAETM